MDPGAGLKRLVGPCSMGEERKKKKKIRKTIEGENKNEWPKGKGGEVTKPVALKDGEWWMIDLQPSQSSTIHILSFAHISEFPPLKAVNGRAGLEAVWMNRSLFGDGLTNSTRREARSQVAKRRRDLLHWPKHFGTPPTLGELERRELVMLGEPIRLVSNNVARECNMMDDTRDHLAPQGPGWAYQTEQDDLLLRLTGRRGATSVSVVNGTARQPLPV